MSLVRWFAEMLVHNPIGLLLGLLSAFAFVLFAVFFPVATALYVVAVALLVWWAK